MLYTNYKDDLDMNILEFVDCYMAQGWTEDQALDYWDTLNSDYSEENDFDY